MFSCELFEIFKNICFEKHLRMAASEIRRTPSSSSVGFNYFYKRRHHKEAVVRRCSIKKSVLKNFAKFTGKHLCQSLLFNKGAGLRRYSRVFIVSFEQISHIVLMYQLLTLNN